MENKESSLRAQRRSLQDRQRAEKICRSMTDASTEVLLLRHGETDWNIEFRLQGQHSEDAPLNATGEAQSSALAARLALGSPRAHSLASAVPQAPELASGASEAPNSANGKAPITAVYSSDLRRALQTAGAAAAALGVSVTADAALRERHLGVLEGLTKVEAAAQQPEAWAALRCGGPTARIARGGESVADLRARTVAGVEAIAARHPGQRVAVFTHGGVLGACFHHASGHAFPGKLVNCAVNRVRIEGSKWLVLEWGSTEHLQGTGYQQEAFGGSKNSG